MTKEIELTIKLKELGIESRGELLKFRKSGKHLFKWTIESWLTWLRENGWIYQIMSTNSSEYIVWVKQFIGDGFFEITIEGGHELEGLLECMVKIEEDKQ